MTIDRRRFLLGVGGAAMALPWLEGTARAAPPPARNFVAFATPNGGVWGASMFPDDATLQPAGTYAGHAVRQGALVPASVDGDTVISPVLRASAGRLTPSLAAELTVLRGLDLSWNVSHHTGCHLGNFAATWGDTVDGARMLRYPSPTIDQVLAWSPAFLTDTATLVDRSVALGAPDLSWGWSDPITQRGLLQPRLAYTSTVALYRHLFRPREPFGALPAPLVDRVLDGYRALIRDPRLAAADRQRLDAHVSGLRDVERRLALDLACDPGPPAVDTDTLLAERTYSTDAQAQIDVWQLRNDVLVAALACGVTRIATCHVEEDFTDFATDWHQDVAHHAADLDGVKQALEVTAHQRFFAEVFVDLVAKLAARPGATGSLLDDSLVVWTQESGQFTHSQLGMPVVTAGRAGGGWRPGGYVDLRDLGRSVSYELIADHPVVNHPGVLYNQFLGTVLQAFGLPRSAYETDPAGGYGPLYLSPRVRSYAEAAKVVGDPLPFVR